MPSPFSSRSVTEEIQSDHLSLGGWNRQKRGTTSKATKLHICTFHNNGTTCGKTYSRAEHLRRHQLSHGSFVYHCPASRCNARFVRRDLAQLHFQRRHGELLHLRGGECDSHDWSSEPDPPHYGLVTQQRDSVSNYGTELGSIVSPISHNIEFRNEAEQPMMYHYMQNFESMLFPSNVGTELQLSRHWWLRIGPNLIKQDDTARDIIISFACEHFLYYRYDEGLERMSTLYYTRAISKLYHMMSWIGQAELADQMTPLSLDVLIFIGFLLMPRSSRELQKLHQSNKQISSEEIFSKLIENITLSQGFHALFEKACSLPNFSQTQHFELLSRFGIAPPIPRPNDYLSLPEPIPSEPPPLKYFSYLHDGITTAECSCEVAAAHRTVLELLEQHYTWVIGGSAHAVGQAWGVGEGKIPTPWLPLVKQHDARSMAILAHLVCLGDAGQARVMMEDGSPDDSKSYWWCKPALGWVAWAVEAIAELMPMDWAWAIKWPLGVAHGEIDFRELPVDFLQRTEGGQSTPWLCYAPGPPMETFTPSSATEGLVDAMDSMVSSYA